MHITYNKYLLPLSRALRSNMTKQEVFLWTKLSRKQICDVQFYRQKPIGPYIVDFYAKKPKLVIELDGGQHYEPENMEMDRIRDAYLRSNGFLVLRFDNKTVIENWAGVGQEIMNAIEDLRIRTRRGN